MAMNLNKKKIISMLTGVLVYFIVAFILTGYGNKKVHPDINSKIVDAFEGRYNKGSLTIPKFQNYLFTLDSKKLKGTGVTKDGLFHPEDVTWVGYTYFDEGTLSLTPKEWISHGGYSADVPELPASLRHFYDPTQPAGNRYLRDVAKGRLSAFVQSLFSNPHIDGVEWAVGTPNAPMGVQEHYYTWENGKVWMKAAFEEKDLDKRNALMSKVWRSLGETLHMIADHGCPSHVRNDAHPSPFMNNNWILGNPDPYEEYVDYIRNKQSSTFNGFFGGSADPDLKDELDKEVNILSIAHTLALFSNKHFVTSETINGNNRFGAPVKPINNPSAPYKSPLLENMEYDEDYYLTEVGGYEVKQCTDISYFGGLIPRLVYPYVDMECVKSQAHVLFPNLVEAGVQAMKLYIPSLSVEVTDAKGTIVKGVIKHKTDEEYNETIKYNGKVTIRIMTKKYKLKKEYSVDAKEGKFEADKINFVEGDLAFAEIECGGIHVKSKEFTCGESEIFNYVVCSISCPVDFITKSWEGSLGTYTTGSFGVSYPFSTRAKVVDFSTSSFFIEAGSLSDENYYKATGNIKDGVITQVTIKQITQVFEGGVLENKYEREIDLYDLSISLADLAAGSTSTENHFKFTSSDSISIRSMVHNDGSRTKGVWHDWSRITGFSEATLFNEKGKIQLSFGTK